MANIKKTEPPLAIVMGRNYTSRLGMIRAAGMAGCDVVTIQTNRKRTSVNPIDASSKYVIQSLTAIEPCHEDILKPISQFRGLERDVLLLPTDDYTASVVDLNMDQLRDDFLMPHINNTQGALVRLMNKISQKEKASNVGLKVAKGWLALFEDGEYHIPQGISYPCFTKPNESYKRPLKHLMKKCCNEHELISHLVEISKVSKDPILIEQYVEIEKEYAVLGLALGEKVIIPDIIKMKSDFMGVTAVGEIDSIDSLPGLSEMLEKFIKETHFTGLFDIDLYESGNIIYFNELNVRFGASGYAVTHSMINLPGLLIKYFLGKDVNGYSQESFKSMLFANEKTCFAKFISGQWNYSEYRKMLNSVDFSFIKNEGDIRPYVYFKKKELYNRMKKIVKMVLPIKLKVR